MAKKRKKVIAVQTVRGPGRPKKSAPNPIGRPKARRKNKWNRMHVRHILYQHYKNRYPNWQSTKEDAALAIERLKAAGYKSATKQGILNVIKSQRLAEIQKRKELERPSENVEHFFQNNQQLLSPIPFFQVDAILCLPWREISNKVVLWTKHIWSGGAIYHGGSVIPYNETFAEYTRGMAKLQEQAKRDGQTDAYISDWYYKLITKNARWDNELGAYMVEVITCNGDGEKTFYFNEEEGAELPPIREEKPPAPEEKPPEKIPEPEEKPPSKELTSEERVEIEKEKVRAEAEGKKEYKISQGRQYAELLKEKVITFDQFKELMSELNKS
jgi:hypothetical protein